MYVLINTILNSLALFEATIRHVNGRLLQAVQSIKHREQCSEFCLWPSYFFITLFDELQILSSLKLPRFVTASEE